MKLPSSSRCVSLTSLLVLTAVSPITLGAQTAAAPVPSAKHDDEVVQLSPFQVVSDQNGYQALNTLSGTRLNSKLEDLGSSITVVTKQQMTDMALLDINDVFRYEASTEGTDNFTTFNRNRSGGVNDQVQSEPQNANRVRGVGGAGQSAVGANTAFGNFQTNSKIPFDPYNIDAVEVSRGPNSNLFGIGNTSGTVNVVPSQARLERQSFNGDLRVDSWGGRRESLNINQPLLKGKLALRVAAVDEAKGFTRKPASERIHREYVTVQARPFKTTTIRVTAERYHDEYRRPNSITPRDTTAEWKAAGSPTWDPTTQIATLANGTKTGIITNDTLLPAGLIGGFNGFYAHPEVYVDNNAIGFFSVQKGTNAVTSGLPSNPLTTANSNTRYLQSGTDLMRRLSIVGPTGLPLYIVPGTADKSIYDWTKQNAVAPNHGTDGAKTFSAEVEQILVHTQRNLLAARLGAFQQKFNRQSFAMIDNLESVIYVDVNEKLLDGRPNPYFKRPYIEADAPSITASAANSAIETADLAYQLTPGEMPRWLKWIGQQRFGVHGEQNFADSWGWNSAERVADTNHPWINQTAALGNTILGAQAIGKRYYVGDSQGQNMDYGPSAQDNIVGNYPLTWFNNLTGKWSDEPVSVKNLLSSGQGARARTEIRTYNATAQNYFFGDRLVTTVGWRRDRQRSRTSSGSITDKTTGLADPSPNQVFGPTVGYFTPSGLGPINLPGWAEASGDTKTYGAVIKATSWLNFHVNKSDSFKPVPSKLALNDAASDIPDPHGYATEWGFSLATRDGKFNVRINHFQTKDLNAQGSEISTLGNRYLDMEGRPDSSNNIQGASFRYFATNIALGRLAAQGNKNPTAAQLDPMVAQLMGLTPEFYNRMVYSGASQPQTVATTDTSSRGWELEATYNPTRNWRMKFTGSQMRSQDDRVGTEILDWWVNKRMPVWTTLHSDIVSGDGKGPTWWTTVSPLQRTDTPQTRWIGEQYGPYWAAATNVGRPRSQIREYHFAGLTNYDFTEGKLKNFNVGGAVRFESRGSIGFLAGAPETSGPYQGAVLFLDTNKPVWDKARAYFDFSAGYRFKFFGDKIRGKAQLNIRNAFESGRLQPVAVNPDGTPYAYRIVDPRQFILSTSFEL
jgi:outer membrane receptor protein involved in Fe transport